MELHRYLAAAAVGPRRERAALLAAGAVTVDGQIVRDPHWPVPEGAAVRVHGQEISPREPLVLMLNKPTGFLTATRDAAVPTVLDLLPPGLGDQFVFPIGRLDLETEGLLLLTNDGGFAKRVLKPERPLVKCYEARHYGAATEADVRAFAGGMTLRDGLVCAPAALKPLEPGRSLVWVAQGKRHQVRRMLFDRGLRVRQLKRLAMGGLTLGDLPVGKTRVLGPEDLELLFSECYKSSPECPFVPIHCFDIEAML